VRITNSTIARNVAVTFNNGFGGGINGSATVKNTIIALNVSGSKPDVRGTFTSAGFNLIGKNDGAEVSFTAGNPNANNDIVGTGASPVDPKLDPNGLQNNGGPTQTIALPPLSPAIEKGTSNGLTGPLTSDQRGSGFPRTFDDPGAANSAGGDGADIGAFEQQFVTSLVANVSTRLPVGLGDNALFEGFIVQGPAGSSKKIIVRALGPYLSSCCGVFDALVNPTLDIFDANTVKVATNNDWKVTQTGGLITTDQSAEIAASGLAPKNEVESAIIANLAPGRYTAVVRGLGDSVGTGLVDAYDLTGASAAKVANFATRGLVQPGDKLLTAGFIIQNGSVRAVIRAIGPSLVAFNISNALPDTTLQLRNQNGDLVQENDDWETDQKQELINTGLQPTNSKEAALVRTIQPGQYTAQVRGKPESTGIGVVEIYFIQ
jgi:hypothetical protein